MCEAYFRHLCEKAGRNDLQVESAGTFAGNGEPASSGSVETMKRFGIDLSGHRSSQLTLEKIKEADIIIPLTAGHKFQIGKMMPTALAKTHLLLEYVYMNDSDVLDPMGSDIEGYGECFYEMKPALENLFLDIIKNNTK